MEQEIKSVEKGWGESSIFFSVDSGAADFCKVDEIKEETKHVGFGEHCELTNQVYCGYKKGNLVFEMGSSIDVTVSFLI